MNLSSDNTFPAQQIESKGSQARSLYLSELLLEYLPRFPHYLQELQFALDEGSTDLEKVCSAIRFNRDFCQNFTRIAAMAEPPQAPALPLEHVIVSLGKQRVWTVAIASFVLTEMDSPWATVPEKTVAVMGLELAWQALNKARLLNGEELEQSYVAGFLDVLGFLPIVNLPEAGDKTDWLGISPEAVEKQREYFATDCLELGPWVRLLWRLPLTSPRNAQTSQLAQDQEVRSRLTPALRPNDNGSGNLILISRERL